MFDLYPFRNPADAMAAIRELEAAHPESRAVYSPRMYGPAVEIENATEDQKATLRRLSDASTLRPPSRSYIEQDAHQSHRRPA